MDEARRIIRWGIPGWLFSFFLIVYLIIYKIIYILIYNKSLNSLLDTLKNSTTITIIGILASIGILGIPLGFVIYQIYFRIRGNCIERKSFMKWYKENEVLINPDLVKVVKEYSPEKKPKKFIDQIEGIVDIHFRTAISEENPNYFENIINKTTHLVDIIHGLGASHFANMLACLTYIIFLCINLLRSAYINWIFFLVSLIIPIILVILYWLIIKNNVEKVVRLKYTLVNYFLKK